jgi:hypothetical protein
MYNVNTTAVTKKQVAERKRLMCNAKLQYRHVRKRLPRGTCTRDQMSTHDERNDLIKRVGLNSVLAVFIDERISAKDPKASP